MAITKTQKYIFRDEDMPDLDQEPGNPPRQSILGKEAELGGPLTLLNTCESLYMYVVKRQCLL